MRKSNLASDIDKGMAEALKKTNPGLFAAVERLIDAGQTPKQIERHVKASTKAPPLILSAVRSTAEYLRSDKI